MAKNSIMTDAKDTMVEAAKSGAEGMKTVAGEALGAAAVAAAGVVLDHVSKALGQGAQDVEANKPAMTQAAAEAVNFAGAAPARKSAKKKSAKKAAAAPAKKSAKKSTKKTVKKAAANKKTAAKKSAPAKSAKKSSAKKAAPKNKAGAKRKTKK
jgi:hypothetical protein